MQNKFQLIFVHPTNLSRLELFVVETKSVVEEFESIVGKPTGNAHEVLFIDRRIFADDFAGDSSVLRQNQQSGGVDIEPPGGFEALQLCGVEFTGRFIALPPTGYGDQLGSELMAIFRQVRYITDGLIEENGNLRLLASDPFLC